MATETVKVGEQVMNLETRPITLIAPSAAMASGPKIEYPDRFSISPEVTLYHAERVQKLDPDFEKVWRLFHKSVGSAKIDKMPTADEIRKMGTGSTHLMGLIDLTLKIAVRKKVPVVWIYPESFMHPAWQVGLADLAIYFADIKPAPDGESYYQ